MSQLKVFFSLILIATADSLLLTMGGNSFGKMFRITTFGESHGPAVGVIVDGCPPNVKIFLNDIQMELNRRRPGQSRFTTPRKEEDIVEILSGIEDNLTLGTPISAFVRNKNQRGQDYNDIGKVYRPSHADATYDSKYGIRAIAGGGRSSARETIARVIGGAIAKKVLSQYCNMEILAYVKCVQDIECDVDLDALNIDQVRQPEDYNTTRGLSPILD